MYALGYLKKIAQCLIFLKTGNFTQSKLLPLKLPFYLIKTIHITIYNNTYKIR